MTNQYQSIPVASIATNMARVLLGVCFVSDGILNLASYDVRIAYLDLANASHFWNGLAAFVYAAAGLLLVANRFLIPAVVSLGGMLIVMTLILHTDYSPGTIGEYPAELRGEVNFKETVVHTAMIASLMLIVHLALSANRTVGNGINKWLLPVARILIGLYFVTNAGWQWFYYDIRVEHIVATGGNPGLLPIVIAVQSFFGVCVISGIKLRWFIPVLMVVITLSTIAVHGDLSPDAPYPPNVQIHQWFVKGAILAGLLLLFGITMRQSKLDNPPEPG